jgi:hypothetical protein
VVRFQLSRVMNTGSLKRLGVALAGFIGFDKAQWDVAST